jgi:LPXTG-site transpeptidase (sortase) family protein
MTGLLTFIFSVLSLAAVKPVSEIPPQETPVVVVAQAPIVHAAEQYFPPARLIIDSIDMNVPVSDNGTVSWWKYGAKPGEKGSAVLAGHYKVESGAPGVFYKLNNVEVGDVVLLNDENGSKVKFQVIDKKIFKLEDFPTREIYTNKDGESLNMVTCTGDYISSTGTYSHRLVVYARKV